MVEKTIIFFIFLFISTNVYAFDGKLAFSILGDSTLRGQDNSFVRYISEIELGHRISNFRFYTNLQNYMDKFDEGSFTPVTIKYDVGISAEIKYGIYTKINHVCIHPINNIGIVEQYNKLEIGIIF